MNNNNNMNTTGKNGQNPQNIEMPNQVNQGPTLNNSEVIGQVRKDTQKSPINMLILFSVLILAVFLVPEITPYFSNILALVGITDNSDVYSNSDTTNKKTTDENPSEDTPSTSTVYYDIVDTITIDYNDITISNLKKETDGTNYYLTYSVKNNSTNTFSFLENRIYFDLYNSEKTYLGRILIDTDTLISGASSSVKSVISSSEYNDATSMEVLKRTDDDYPEITLTSNKLTCTNGKHSIIYTFSNKLLTTIDDTYTYTTSLDDTTFTIYSLNYQTKISDLTKKTGVTAGFVPSTDTTLQGFVSTAKIDYKNTEENFQSYEDIYYPKNTQAKTIKYELESLDYSCD